MSDFTLLMTWKRLTLYRQPFFPEDDLSYSNTYEMEHNVFQYSCAVLMKIYSIYKTLIQFIRFFNVTCKIKLTKLN